MSRRGRCCSSSSSWCRCWSSSAWPRDANVTLRGDGDVTLQTRPVEPRDVFRGDSVVLNYEISTIETTGPTDRLEPNDTVYVELVQVETLDRRPPPGPAV